METTQVMPNDLYFLSGGGEMGALIRAKNWKNTPLGHPRHWPQSLQTMVGVMLENPFGMYIAWGKEYTQIYNDGYRPILGSTKHPNALGISTKETFKEIWHIIGPMFEGVMNGKAVGFPDFMLPLNRNGFVEECYFDFSYSPIRKEDGAVGGVLVTVIETTNKKKAEEALKES
ncbi:MAG: histidine kinase, partial [Bacteroidota bacterium]|nr:histidine kinase [Bacteroidota bacterium]